jgi:hypothetical protein
MTARVALAFGGLLATTASLHAAIWPNEIQPRNLSIASAIQAPVDGKSLEFVGNIVGRERPQNHPLSYIKLAADGPSDGYIWTAWDYFVWCMYGPAQWQAVRIAPADPSDNIAGDGGASLTQANVSVSPPVPPMQAKPGDGNKDDAKMPAASGAAPAKTSADGQWIDPQTGKAVEVGPNGARISFFDADRAFNPNTGKSYIRDKDGVWKDRETGKVVSLIPINTQLDPKNPNRAISSFPGGKVFTQGGVAQALQQAPGGGPAVAKQQDASAVQQQAQQQPDQVLPPEMVLWLDFSFFQTTNDGNFSKYSDKPNEPVTSSFGDTTPLAKDVPPEAATFPPGQGVYLRDPKGRLVYVPSDLGLNKIGIWNPALGWTWFLLKEKPPEKAKTLKDLFSGVADNDNGLVFQNTDSDTNGAQSKRSDPPKAAEKASKPTPQQSGQQKEATKGAKDNPAGSGTKPNNAQKLDDGIKQKLETALKQRESLRDELKKQDEEVDERKLKATKENTLDAERAVQDAETAREQTANKLEKLAYRIDALQAGRDPEQYFKDSDLTLKLDYKLSLKGSGAYQPPEQKSSEIPLTPEQKAKLDGMWDKVHKLHGQFVEEYNKRESMKAGGKASALDLDIQNGIVRELLFQRMHAQENAEKYWHVIQEAGVDTKVEQPQLPESEVLQPGAPTTPPKETGPGSGTQGSLAPSSEQPVSILVKANALGSQPGEPFAPMSVRLYAKYDVDVPGTADKQAKDVDFDKPSMQTTLDSAGRGMWTIDWKDRVTFGLSSAKPGAKLTVDLDVPKRGGYVLETTGKTVNLDFRDRLPAGVQVGAYRLPEFGGQSFVRLDEALVQAVTIAARDTAIFNALMFFAAWTGDCPTCVVIDWCWEKQPAVVVQPAGSTAHGQQLPHATLRLGETARNRWSQ